MLSIKSIPAYVLIALTIAALSAGIILLVSDRSSGSPGVEIMLPTVTPTTDSKVYVSGAVYDPGVYLMQVGDRLVDAIAAAGGATQGARLSCINLALRVTTRLMCTYRSQLRPASRHPARRLPGKTSGYI